MKTDSTPDRNRPEPRSLPPLDPSDGDVVASVACTAVVGESPGVNIVVDSIETVGASASAVVASVSASEVVEGIAAEGIAVAEDIAVVVSGL